MTTNSVAQSNSQSLEDEKLVYFQSKVSIPDGYQFKRKLSIEVDGIKASLYRYEKDYNRGLGSEHFSFIVADSKPYKILGFTQMDAKYSSDILWQYEQKRRISQMYLHDSWLISQDKKDIQAVVERSFLNGILNELNIEDISKGFHPDFTILTPTDEAINRLPLATWIEVVKDFKADQKRVDSGERKVECAFNILDITNDVAVVKTELYREKQMITTDYMFVSRLSDGWKVISKTSNEHRVTPFKI